MRGTRIDRYQVAEDAALAALLSIERAWTKAHPGGEPTPDVWGEGPSRLRLADLGLDARVRTHGMVGVCQRHGEFSFEWTGLDGEVPPELGRCTATADGQRCSLSGPVARTSVVVPR